ncbi:sigma-70 family RNA polymerase sigma factor [Rhodococcus triatomae]
MDDVTLLARAREGDQRAFAQLVEAHRNHVWAVCLSTTGNAHDAEDALQNTLIAAWQHLDRFRGESRFGTWLHRIAVNNALMVVRKRKPDTDLTDFTDDDARTVTLTDDGPRFDDRIADHDALRAALALLPEDFRTALVLRELGDLTYADIAEHQGVGVATVKSRLNRARTQLARHLRESAA